jgi:hypothetical protein
MDGEDVFSIDDVVALPSRRNRLPFESTFTIFLVDV